MSSFFDAYALTGGILIGLSATFLLLLTGRIAGISGICANLLSLSFSGKNTRGALFLLAMILAGGVTYQLMPAASEPLREGFPVWLLILSGFVVGFGTRLANGCTSGHGVCGLGRRSWRSLVATLCFMATGIMTVWMLRFTGLIG